MGVTKVTLRKRLLPSGKITLYLDFYPPLRDPHSRKYVRHEYLGIYLVNKPRFQNDKDANKEKIAQAEAIRSERELALTAFSCNGRGAAVSIGPDHRPCSVPFHGMSWTSGTDGT